MRIFAAVETQGFTKFIVDGETKRILGAATLGVSSDKFVQSILQLMYAGLPYAHLQHAMPIHPTLRELLPTLPEDL